MQATLPSIPIERGRPGAGLLAHVLVSKYADLDAFRQWLDVTGPRLSRRPDLAVAVRYALTRWPALNPLRRQRRLEIDNAAERSLRGIAVGRKNRPFAGSDKGGHRAASTYKPGQDSQA